MTKFQIDKSKLKKLKKRFKELEKTTTQGFKTDKELDTHEKKHQAIFNEYYNLGQEIEDLENELMTPEEKEKHEKLMRFLELKAKGKPFDPEAEGLL